MYSRNHPSPRYQALLTLYQQMHREGDSSQKKITEKTFPGLNAIREAPKIKKLIETALQISFWDLSISMNLNFKNLWKLIVIQLKLKNNRFYLLSLTKIIL